MVLFRKKRKSEFLTRTEALKLSGLSLPEFRRACILRGVFPRLPKSGDHKNIYYLVGDVRNIRTDPILHAYRQQATAERRIRRALNRKEFLEAEMLKNRLVPVDLSLVLRQRYPSLTHAIQDMDDALSCVGMFARLNPMPAENITGETINECRAIMDHWNALVANLGCLDKTFVSVKGFYYQANILGQEVLWLVPHDFPASVTPDVDLVLLSYFLDLYKNLLKFVLFKLYNLSGYKYPPTKIMVGAQHRMGWMNMNLEPTGGESRLISSKDPESIERRQVFRNQTFYISREVNTEQTAFVLKSGGAKVVGFDEVLNDQWIPLSPLTAEDPSITHHIVDRPEKAFDALFQSVPTEIRTFIQPQWVFDCFNMKALLPTTPYRPCIEPPPHLSPFQKYDQENDYVPDHLNVLKQWTGEYEEQKVQTGFHDDEIIAKDLQDHEEVQIVVKSHMDGIDKISKRKTKAQDAPQETESNNPKKLSVALKASREKKQLKAKQLDVDRRKVSLSSNKRRLMKQVEAKEKKETEKTQALIRKKKLVKPHTSS